MAQYTSPAQLTGLFKEAYGDSIENLVPDAAVMIKMIPFVARDKETGNIYHQPVVVSLEQGVTYGSASSGAFLLNNSISMMTQDAQVAGSQVVLRGALSYDSAARASNSKKAFVKATELMVENLLESITKRLEIASLHGGMGLGVLSGSTNVNATSTTVQVTTATWATGIWAGMENAEVQFYTSGGSLISSGADSIFVISNVDSDAKTIKVTGTATGITALDAAAAAGPSIYFNGAYGNEMLGLHYQLVTSGTVFNISNTTYNLWKGNVATISGSLTFGKLLGAISKAVQKGLNEKVVVLVNPTTWSGLNSDLAALRRFDSSYSEKKGDMGNESLMYYGQNGAIEVKSHNVVKEGQAFVFPPRRLKFIGAQNISFKTPGREDEIFLHLANNAGFELRVYADISLFVETPSRCVYISGFTNSSL